MSARATPRPWRVFHHGEVIEIQDANGVAVVFWQGFDRSDRSRTEHLANARLIVKAVNAYGVGVLRHQTFCTAPTDGTGKAQP